jgi:hypothetical protein
LMITVFTQIERLHNITKLSITFEEEK